MGNIEISIMLIIARLKITIIFNVYTCAISPQKAPVQQCICKSWGFCAIHAFISRNIHNQKNVLIDTIIASQIIDNNFHD